MRTIVDLASALTAGSVSARELVTEALARIDHPDTEGQNAFLTVDHDHALARAEVVDRLRAAGVTLSPFSGIPLAVKDLFDVAGQATTAGSTVLASQQPAAVHAPAVARMINAGFIPLGRTHMTEFAFSGLGLNAHAATPSSPWGRKGSDGLRRIPGGSSSGSAVAVADGIVPVALGTDTGGSCRIPAAFCGVVGYKPTADRVPVDGVFPLAPSLDSVGPLGASVWCCAVVDHVLSGGTGHLGLAAAPPERLRLGVARGLFTEQMDPEVAAGFDGALQQLADAGARLDTVDVKFLDRLGDMKSNGGIAAAEAWQVHRHRLAEDGDRYDARVRTRIEAGAATTAADYLDLLAARQALIEQFNQAVRGFDALVMPTVPIVAPTIESLDGPNVAAYTAANLMALRNTSVINMVDGCALSIPIPAADGPGVGLMVAGSAHSDRQVLAAGLGIESVLGR